MSVNPLNQAICNNHNIFNIFDILTCNRSKPFDTYYNIFKNSSMFKNNNMFKTLYGIPNSNKNHNTNYDLRIPKNWTQNPGVYVIWDTQNDEKPIYIGMCGKFKNSTKYLNQSKLSERKGRWTPYNFCLNQSTYYGCQCGYFNYNPEYTYKTNGKNANGKGYKNTIPLSDIKVDCFIFDNTLKGKQIIPSYLEALFLQAHLMQHGCLPDANREF